MDYYTCRMAHYVVQKIINRYGSYGYKTMTNMLCIWFTMNDNVLICHYAVNLIRCAALDKERLVCSKLHC